jgi:SOS-response transcriptional repressor LexA
VTDRPPPPKPKVRRGKPPRSQDRGKFKTLQGAEGDLLEVDLAVLDWVGRYVASLGYPPTVQELDEAFGLGSKQLAHAALRRLEAYGFLDVDPGVTRGIRLVNLPPTADQGTVRLRLWLAEAAQLVEAGTDPDDPKVKAWLRKIRTATW